MNYADDTLIVTQSTWKNAKAIKNRLEDGFGVVSNYYKSWKIKINESKTETIMLTKSKKNANEKRVLQNMY